MLLPGRVVNDSVDASELLKQLKSDANDESSPHTGGVDHPLETVSLLSSNLIILAHLDDLLKLLIQFK